jgi:regulator of protease activity HflC (stomatin/prohibitin superfamily)
MQGGDPNASVKTMCESIVRNQLANCTLDQVLRNRHLVRDQMKEDLEKQLTGWGIWLETVELT